MKIDPLHDGSRTLVNALNVYVREVNDRLIKMESSNLRTIDVNYVAKSATGIIF